MSVTVVDVADARFSRNPDEILEIPSLGSCVGLVIFDPKIKAGGVVVYVLPDSNEIHTSQLDDAPCMFADTAIVHFLQIAMEQGIRPERAKRVLVGGGEMLGQTGNFNLGTRNSLVAIDTLAKLGLDPTHRSIGGIVNRTASLHIKTGMVHISMAGQEIEKL